MATVSRRLANVAHRCPTQPTRPRDAAQITLHQRDARALHRDIRSRAHCDADLGSCERRGIIDSVTRHRHHATLALQLEDDVALLRGQDVGANVVEPQRLPDGVRRRLVVAGQHHHPQTLTVEQVDRLFRGRLHRVGHGQQAGDTAVNRHEHHCRSVAAPPTGTARARRWAESS